MTLFLCHLNSDRKRQFPISFIQTFHGNSACVTPTIYTLFLAVACPLYQNQDNNIVIRIHCNPNDLVPLEIIEHVLKLASAVNPGQVNCPGGRKRTEDSFHPG